MFEKGACPKKKKKGTHPDSDANEPVTADSPQEDLVPLWRHGPGAVAENLLVNV